MTWHRRVSRRFLWVVMLAMAASPVRAQQRGDLAITGGRVVDPASGTDRVVSILAQDQCCTRTANPQHFKRQPLILE